MENEATPRVRNRRPRVNDSPRILHSSPAEEKKLGFPFSKIGPSAIQGEAATAPFSDLGEWEESAVTTPNVSPKLWHKEGPLPYFRYLSYITMHRERMATVIDLLLLCTFLLPLVQADYNCSRPDMIIETYTYDFLRTFGKAATEVKAQAPKTPEHFLNFTLGSRDTHRNVTVWSQCQVNDTEKYCARCLGVLFTNIYETCCEQKSSWGTINLRTSCSVGYSAPNYVIPGWTDPGDLPKEIQKEPDPLNLNAAAHSRPPLISFPMLIFSTFFAVY